MALFLLSLMTLPACRSSSRGSDRLAEDSSAIEQIDNSLSFNNITLEQADEKGQVVWQVFARQAAYNESKQYAIVRVPNGQLFQDGKAIYRVRSQTGQVFEDGEKILLKGQVEATDLRTKAVLRGEEAEWRPQEGILTIRNNVRGNHPQIQITAQEGRLYDREQRMELKGQVLAVTAQNPVLAVRTDALTWFMKEERVSSDRPTQIRRLIQNRVTDIATGQKAEVNLKTQLVTLRQNAQIATSDPLMQVTSNELFWEAAQGLLRSEVPLTVLQPQQQIALRANRGVMNLNTRLVDLAGNVQALAQRDQSSLKSDTLNWNLNTRVFRANGNVNLRQTNPPMVANGPQAVGRLENQTIVMSGGRVVSEFIPQ
ncbi:LPS export ABC transporter periplasmic protein LptC [Leptolyngbya sp. FACHB-8]|uniref:LPS export ABC transporter periplasmic protein LptC n=1 Tax=Leptolyngbya sp. FACHB-8 TaxID=2692814 RepID=UPI001A7EFE20|nr:LPS export ABC transporter periplasmic protein LptC [Leptolyngbya sp. FACHB-8]